MSSPFVDNNLQFSEQLCYTTVRLECPLESGKTSTGTGFFFTFHNKETNKYTRTIITNKHVIEGAISAILHLTKTDSNGNPINTGHFIINHEGFQPYVIHHPDADVDLCAIPVESIIEQATSEGVDVFFGSYTEENIPKPSDFEEFNALEEILMIGYPDGLWDSKNNMPLLRRGITATSLLYDYEGEKEFMIDIACFAGSSGSPVLVHNLTSYATREGKFVNEQRALLVGILYAGPEVIVEGEVHIVDTKTLKTTNEERRMAITSIPINLGYVIKAERIIELGEICKAWDGTPFF